LKTVLADVLRGETAVSNGSGLVGVDLTAILPHALPAHQRRSSGSNGALGLGGIAAVGFSARLVGVNLTAVLPHALPTLRLRWGLRHTNAFPFGVAEHRLALFGERVTSVPHHGDSLRAARALLRRGLRHTRACPLRVTEHRLAFLRNNVAAAEQERELCIA